jgi:hypothetical protein
MVHGETFKDAETGKYVPAAQVQRLEKGQSFGNIVATAETAPIYIDPATGKQV